MVELPARSVGIVDRSLPSAARTFRSTVLPGLNLNKEGLLPFDGLFDPGPAKHEPLELLHPVE